MTKIKFRELNIKELVASTFPYHKELVASEVLYFSKGLYDWKTLYIFIHDNIIGYNYLLIICKYSCKTRRVFIEEKNIEAIKKQLKTAHNHSDFFYKTDLVSDSFNNLTVNESYRLVKYLKKRGIKLFEPTE